MPYISPVVAVIDTAGNLYCASCADDSVTVLDRWHADNSALEDALPCRGCGKHVEFNPRLTVHVAAF